LERRGEEGRTRKRRGEERRTSSMWEVRNPIIEDIVEDSG
jgi:hypothetical protein